MTIRHVSVGIATPRLRDFEMRGMPICYWQLARLMNHFVAHPEDRATLGTPQGSQLVTDILAAG